MISPIIAISGPTGSGKTAAACELAQRIGGEIISCDSMQIYKGLDIGTGKATEKERKAVPHHMLDIIEPDVSYSVADYVNDARESIGSVRKKAKFPIICGGTGMYIDALLRSGDCSADMSENSVDYSAYSELETDILYERLRSIDPDYAGMIPANNRRRIERALALYDSYGIRVSERTFFRDMPLPEKTLLVVLAFSDRSLLYRRINARVDAMVEDGILKEAEYVYRNREQFKTAAQAIGYKEFFPYFDKTDSLEQCVETLKKASRNYAKRQMTWFRKKEDVFEIFVDQLKKDQVATIIEDKARSMEIIQ